MTETDQHLQELRSQHVGRLLLRAHRAFSVRAAEMLRQRGYPGVALRHIDLLPHIEVGGTRSTVLAQRAGMTKQGMGKLVAELEERDLVERVPDPTDGRAMLVRFTADGMGLLRTAVGIVQELECTYQEILGEQGLRDLKYALERIVDHPDEGKHA